MSVLSSVLQERNQGSGPPSTRNRRQVPFPDQACVVIHDVSNLAKSKSLNDLRRCISFPKGLCGNRDARSGLARNPDEQSRGPARKAAALELFHREIRYFNKSVLWPTDERTTADWLALGNSDIADPRRFKSDFCIEGGRGRTKLAQRRRHQAKGSNRIARSIALDQLKGRIGI